jgi:hypothetical protein
MNSTLTRHALLRFIGAVAAAAIAVLLTGCDPNRMGDELSERVEMDGYSFLPPVDPGWLIASRSTEKITLLKAGNMEGQSYLIEGGHVALDSLAESDGLLDFTEMTHRNVFPQPRFRIREHDVSDLQISGADCAMSHVVAEDRDPGTGSNVVTAVLLDAVGTICVHPSRPDLGIAMIYTHRSFPEDRDRGFEALASSVLRTQQFGGDAGRGDN